MGQTLSEEQPRCRSRHQLTLELVSPVPCLILSCRCLLLTASLQAHRFKDESLTPLESLSFKDVFKSLSDRQGNVRYLRQAAIARVLELPDIIDAAPVVFQMASYIGAFPFLDDAPAVLELPQMIMLIVIMTERYRRLFPGRSSDRTKLLFRSLAVYDRQLSRLADGSPPSPTSPLGSTAARQRSPGQGDEPGDDLVQAALELLQVEETAGQANLPDLVGSLIPTDNFRKLLMLLLLAAPLEPQESLSQYSDRIQGQGLDHLRSTAEAVLAAFVDVETSPGIRYERFSAIIPVLFPNLFRGLNHLFEHFLFSENLDFSKHKDLSLSPANTNQQRGASKYPSISRPGGILNDHRMSQISTFLPSGALFGKMRLLYSGNDAGFSMGSFEAKVFDWRAPTVLLVSGTRLGDGARGGQETRFLESLPPRRFPPGSASGRLVFGIYVREHWRRTSKACFGDSETVLFQLEPIHDVFPASTINTDYIAFTKPPGNQPCLSCGCPHSKPTQSSAHRKSGIFSLGAVSLLLNDSFEYAVFQHDYTSRGGAFHTSLTRPFDFQDRFQIDGLEVWGCGGLDEAKAQAERKAWEEREAEARRRINLGSSDIAADRALLEMAGLVGANRSGGSMT